MKVKELLCYTLIAISVVVLGIILVRDIGKSKHSTENDAVQENITNTVDTVSETKQKETEKAQIKDDNGNKGSSETLSFKHEQTITIYQEGSMEETKEMPSIDFSGGGYIEEKTYKNGGE